MTDMLLEVCVDNAAGIDAAVAGGADRIELCSALELGGLTPSAGLMQLAATAPVPVYAMIRPRAGDFVFTRSEFDMMRADIDMARQAGLAGVVLGANRADGALDRTMLTELVSHAAGLGLTLHRAFDCTGPDFRNALEAAIELGFHRILTSGGALTAMKGVDALARLIEQAQGRISIMPGSGVNAGNAADLLKTLHVKELHASCSKVMVPHQGLARQLGFVHDLQKQTDAEIVRALKTVLRGWKRTD